MSGLDSTSHYGIEGYFVDFDRLKEFGIIPGIYEHFKGGEYLTLTAGCPMSESGTDESVGEPIVVYIALYEHPRYGKNAVWTRQISKFNEDVTFKGSKKSRFLLVKKWEK